MNEVGHKPPPLVLPKLRLNVIDSWKKSPSNLSVQRKPSDLQIDISIAKKRDARGHTTLGKSTVNVSGSLEPRKIIVSDRVIRISLPKETGIKTLNLIYNQNGEPNLPEVHRTGVYGLLSKDRPDLVRVEPVALTEAPEVLHDIKLGEFDLIATATGNNNDVPSFVPKSLGALGGTSGGPPELQLLRIWRTGEFYTYNQKTGVVNKINESRQRSYQALAKLSETYPVIPAGQDLNFGDSSNYFQKYLIQNEIEEQFVKPKKPKFNKYPHSFPEKGSKTTRQQLERSLSFSDELGGKSKTNHSKLRRTLTERDARPVRLTRSNVLRHEKHQHLRPETLPSITTFIADVADMDQSKYGQQKMFDADNALHEENLKCPVCRNFYDTRDRNPHILHCLHSACNACLKTRVRGEMVQCSVCSEVAEVPNNDLDLLPTDYARQHLVKFFKVRNKTTEIGCDSCDPRNRATHRCKECDEFICGACTEAHKRTKVTKGHNVVAVDALKRSNLDEFHHKRTCPVPEHEDQPFSFYCYSKGCDRPICSLCAVTDHNKSDGHDIRNINDVYVENKRVVENLLIDVKHKKNVAEEAIQSIEDEIQNLYIKESTTEEELDQTFLACQKQLEKRKNELKEKLAATSKAKKKGMENQLDKLISEKNSLDHAGRFSTNVLGYSDATEFLQIKDALFARLSELKELEIDTRPHNKADIKFHAHKMLEAFQKFTSKLGEVWSTTAFIPNTKIQSYDIGLGREETAMIITLHDYERRPLAEPGVDMRVEVTNPLGKKSRAQVIDLTSSEGSYKVLYQGTKLGDHRASVFVLGIPVIDPGIVFKVRRHGALEQDVVRDFESTGAPHVKAKVDSGIQRYHDDEDEGEDERGRQRTKSYRVFGDIICPDFTFDAPTCHTQNMVTADLRTLKNVRGRVAHIGTALKNYRGVIGTKPISKSGRFYFEVVVYFFIKRTMRNDLIFEVALSQKAEIDKNYTVDGSPYAWTVCARRCPLCRTVCLMTYHNGVRFYHNPLTENSPPGTTLRTTIGFLMDMKTRSWHIVDAKNRRLFFRFKNIDTSKPLWPVFGAYSSEFVSVSLALKTGKDIQAVPDIPEN